MGVGQQTEPLAGAKLYCGSDTHSRWKWALGVPCSFALQHLCRGQGWMLAKTPATRHLVQTPHGHCPLTDPCLPLRAWFPQTESGTVQRSRRGEYSRGGRGLDGVRKTPWTSPSSLETNPTRWVLVLPGLTQNESFNPAQQHGILGLLATQASLKGLRQRSEGRPSPSSCIPRNPTSCSSCCRVL